MSRALSKGTKVAIEFRHPSWCDDEVYAVLRKHRVALCIADSEAWTTPQIATSSFGYLRLRRALYNERDIQHWYTFAQEQAWKRAYISFKHEDTGTGPIFAQRFLAYAAS